MSVSNASIVTAPTSITVTGGTAVAFSSLGLADGRQTLFVAADTDQRTRRSIDVSVKPAKSSSSAPNGYTQPRATLLLKKPKVLANGKITVGTLRVEMAYDVEFTQPEIQELVDFGAQFFCDPDFLNFWKQMSPQ